MFVNRRHNLACANHFYHGDGSEFAENENVCKACIEVAFQWQTPGVHGANRDVNSNSSGNCEHLRIVFQLSDSVGQITKTFGALRTPSPAAGLHPVDLVGKNFQPIYSREIIDALATVS